MSASKSSPSYYPITGRISTQVFDRLPVEDLKDQYPYQWALFILGFAYIKGTPIPFPNVTQPPLRDSTSFMEIGAIHGKPYREWTGDKRTPEEAKVDFSYDDKKDMYPTPSRFGGYCHHSAVTFPSWHRPYIMLIEQAIGEYAENIARQIESTNHDEKGRWTDAAKQLRFPYWDWADPKVTQEGVPSLFVDEEVSIRAPGKNTVTVPNPLVSFTYPYIPKDFGDGTRGTITAYFTKWKQTLRYAASSPDATTSDVNSLQATMKKNADSARTGVGSLFLFPDNGNSAMIYDEFSNNFNESAQAGSQTNTGSLEGVHDTMHANLGGNGNMGWPDYSAFDPIFYFHHANVDRLLALWEWCYPDYWMGDGYTPDNGGLVNWTLQRGTYSLAYSQKIEDDGEWGVLTPFRHPDGTYWMSKETRFFTPDAYPKYYSYKKFQGVKVDKAAASLQERQEARARIAKYYGVDLQTDATKISLPSWEHIPVPGVDEVDLPSNFQPIQYFRVFKVLVRLYEHAVGTSYYFNLYYKTELVGSVAVFAREDNSPCKACAIRRENQSIVRGIITISPTIINKIVVRHSATPSKKTLDDTISKIAQSLTGQLVDLSGNVIASAQGGDQAAAVPADQALSKMVQPAEVSLLSSALAEHAEDPKQPVHFFDWQRHADLFPSGWKDETKTSDAK